MATIKLTNLGGISPSLLPRNLPDNGAQKANNLQANTPEFRPFNNDLVVATIPDINPKSLYRFARKANGTLIENASEGWRSHLQGVDVAKGQLNDDRTERTYYTFSDGSAPPRVFDNTEIIGSDRQLGVPKPLVKPQVSAVEVYTFTEELKRIENTKALQAVVRLAEINATSTLVGLGSAFEVAGWLKEKSFSSAPDADRHIVRVFALDPGTNQIIHTYSSMAPGEAAWIFDPALGGDYATNTSGVAMPGWAAGHSKWWRIRLRAFANAYDIGEPVLSAMLQSIKMPGTQELKPYLTAVEADKLANDIAAQFDKDGGRVGTLIDTLNGRQAEMAAAFNQGGALALKQAVVAFYARTDIASSINAATDAFAESIWRYASILGTATAPPFYID